MFYVSARRPNIQALPTRTYEILWMLHFGWICKKSLKKRLEVRDAITSILVEGFGQGSEGLGWLKIVDTNFFIGVDEMVSIIFQ